MGIVQRVDAVDRLATVRWFGQEPCKLGVCLLNLMFDELNSEQFEFNFVFTRFQEEPEELSLYEIVVRPDLQCGLGDKVLLWQQRPIHTVMPLFSLTNVMKNHHAVLEEIASKLRKLSNEEDAKYTPQYEEHEVDRADQFNIGSQ